jgi:hypothetical protein
VASGSAADGAGQLEERVADVCELIDPVAVCSLPPLSKDERHDPNTVAEAYGHAYDELLDAV